MGNSPCYLRRMCNSTDIFSVNTSKHTVSIPGLDPDARYEVNVVVGMGEAMTYQVPYSATFMYGSGQTQAQSVTTWAWWQYMMLVIGLLLACACCMFVSLQGLKYYNRTHGFMFRSLLSSDGNASSSDTSYLDSREMAPTSLDNDDPEDTPMSLRLGGGDDDDET